MFDLARVLALGWALLRSLQVPSRRTALFVVVAVYPQALQRSGHRAADLPIARQTEALRWSRLSLAVVLLQVLALLAAIARVGASSLG